MLFFLGCLLSVMSLIGMELDVVVTSESIAIPSLKELALHNIFCHISDGKITSRQLKEKLPQDILEKIEKIAQEAQPKLFTPTVTKRYLLPTVTPDHRYMLVQDKANFSRLNVNTKQESTLDVLSQKKTEPAYVGLSPSGNLIGCLGGTKLWVEDIVKKEVIAENKWSGIFIKNLSFIGEKALLVEDANNHSHCLSIEENLEGFSTTFPYLGVLQNNLEYLTQHESSILKNKIDGTISEIEVKDLEYISHVRPAIYEPDMIMAYLDMRVGLVHVISLQEKNKLLSMFNPTQGISVSKITALSFAYKGKWLMVAEPVEKGISKLSIVNWQDKKCLYEYRFAEDCISKISYTDHLSQHPCILQTTRASTSEKLYCFDPIKLVASGILNKETEPKTNNNNETNMDIDKN